MFRFLKKKVREGKMREFDRVPNFDSLGTLIDRLIVENVKKSIFEVKLEEASYGDKCDLEKKIHLQDMMIKNLKLKLTDLMVKCWATGDYAVIQETRTFK